MWPTMAGVVAPKSFAEEPEWFGDSPRVQWKRPDPGSEPAMSAAYRQHHAALALRVAARRDGLVPDRRLAEHLGYATETLRRKMRGDVWASTEDLARWDLAFPDAGVYPDASLPDPETRT